MEKQGNIIVTSFYHFTNLENYEELKDPLLSFCNNIDLKGTILLASEGINSTISGTREAIDKLYSYLKKDLSIDISNFKENYCDFKPFLRMKVRLKKEIVAMGHPNLNVKKYCGTYIKPKDWADFINREDVITIDTRNSYEVKMGSFKGAINPITKTFKEFPQWVSENQDLLKNKKVAMFCTGGVRCEKSTSFLKMQGYDEVYHLEGGIIKYLEDTNNSSEAWQGSCFVFDDRVALSDELIPSTEIKCIKCDNFMTTDDIRDTSHVKEKICSECIKKYV